jgi:hypothetical protein
MAYGENTGGWPQNGLFSVSIDAAIHFGDLLGCFFWRQPLFVRQTYRLHDFLRWKPQVKELNGLSLLRQKSISKALRWSFS